MLFNICSGYSIYPLSKKTFYFGNQKPDDNTAFFHASMCLDVFSQKHVAPVAAEASG